MNEIKNFLKKFDFELTGEKIKIGNNYYLINENIKQILSKNKDKPKSAGIFLGQDKEGFSPSLALLRMIETDRKIIVNEKGEWLFICGRDIMEESVIKSNVKSGFALVEDSKGNNLGLAKIDNKIFAKNIIDLGDFLRREK